jgi:hypothetical protein
MSHRKTTLADPQLGLTVASGSTWVEQDYHKVSSLSNGLSPNGLVSVWGRHYPSESP